MTLDEKKRYTQTVECSFHVSMAAVEPKPGSNDVISVYVNHSDADFLLCTLKQGTLFQQTLDLGFVAGETITLYTSGKGSLSQIMLYHLYRSLHITFIYLQPSNHVRESILKRQNILGCRIRNSYSQFNFTCICFLKATVININE